MSSNNGKVAGTLLVVGGIQFVIALMLAEAIYPGYSIASNYISDLGVWGHPSALVFNPSTIILGVTSLAASVYIKRTFNLKKGFLLYTIAGLGSLGVGLFPENTYVISGVPIVHSLSALLAFVFSGIAAIFTYRITKSPYRHISLVLGALTLVDFAVFLGTRDFGALGVGAGGLERSVVYPATLVSSASAATY